MREKLEPEYPNEELAAKAFRNWPADDEAGWIRMQPDAPDEITALKTCIAELQADLATLRAKGDALAEAVQAARDALHFHYVEWDGEPEDAVPLQLARSKCDEALSQWKDQNNG